MHKIFPIQSLAYLISILTIGAILAIELFTSAFGWEVRTLAIPGIVWLIMLALAFNPIWRAIWWCSKKIPGIPDLNHVIYPDLNGEWDMVLESNWSRQLQLLNAATDRRQSFDIRGCEPSALEPLMEIPLRAQIKQTWWAIKMTVDNPRRDTPIKESNTYIAIPRKKTDNEPHSLCYFYDQVNDTDNQADDPKFSAAACLSFNTQTNCLEGTFWTARQWRRAINTAGRMTLTKS